MGFLKEFKTFAMKGNVMDMAVGVIIGGAFGKIVSSLVDDVLMPVIGMLTGGIDFKDLALTVGDANIKYGNFFMIKAINRLIHKREEETKAPPAPPAPSKEEQLLSEIRDILKNK